MGHCTGLSLSLISPLSVVLRNRNRLTHLDAYLRESASSPFHLAGRRAQSHGLADVVVGDVDMNGETVVGSKFTASIIMEAKRRVCVDGISGRAQNEHSSVDADCEGTATGRGRGAVRFANCSLDIERGDTLML